MERMSGAVGVVGVTSTRGGAAGSASFLCGSGRRAAGPSLAPAWGVAGRRGGGPGRRGEVVCMAKKVKGMIKLALDAGAATPAPPVGPALGSQGVNIMAFCKDYNARTADKKGTVIPVEITVYEDKSFDFILKTPPASFLLKKEAKIKKGTALGTKGPKVGSVTEAQVRAIAEIKLPDLNCTDIESAMNTVKGTAQSLGIEVVP